MSSIIPSMLNLLRIKEIGSDFVTERFVSIRPHVIVFVWWFIYGTDKTERERG